MRTNQVARQRASVVMTRPLRVEEQVHHIDGNNKNNSNDNLVVCPDQAYHDLIELRTKALGACGHADWRPCIHCRTYSPLHFLKDYAAIGAPHKYAHPSCRNEYKRLAYARRG